METDELKWRWVYLPYLDMPEKQDESALKAGYAKVCYKSEVDAVIAGLKQKLQDQCTSCPVKMQEDDVVAEFKQKLEDAKSTAYTESVDAGMENRRLKRALWLARAERAYVTTLLWSVYCYQNNCLYFRDFMNEKCNPFRNLPKKTAMEWSDLWETIEIKCRAKMEEYK